MAKLNLNEILLCGAFFFSVVKLDAQVGIGTATPNGSAQLEVNSSSKGFLPPRVSLTGTADASTITTPAAGLLVYNNATSGTAPNNVTPGFYYYNGSAWVRLIVPTDNAANVTGTVAVANGGTGLTSLGRGLIPIGNGTNAFFEYGELKYDLDHASFGVGVFTPGADFGAKFDVQNKASFRTYGSGKALIVDGDAGANYARIYTDAASGTSGDLVLGTYASGAQNHFNQVFLKQSNGFVGISNSNPTTALDVNGVVTATSIASPSITGGSGTTQSLTYKTTTGVGTTGADHIFQVGNNGATEAMRITNNGNVGVGITSPVEKLEVNGNIKGTRIVAGMTGKTYVDGSDAGGDLGTNAAIPLNFSTNGLPKMIIDVSGNVGIGTTNPAYNLDVIGNIRSGQVYASAFTVTSDARLKTVLQSWSNNDEIDFVQFHWKNGSDTRDHFGYLAQDVQKVLPDAVHIDNEGMMSVNYDEVHSFKISNLEQKNIQQEKRILELEQTIVELKKLIKRKKSWR